MFLSEGRLEVVRVDYGIASIPPFRINVLLSSESIRFCAETTRTEPDDKIELREILGPLYKLSYTVKPQIRAIYTCVECTKVTTND